jgi:hypothetical protein
LYVYLIPPMYAARPAHDILLTVITLIYFAKSTHYEASRCVILTSLLSPHPS